jgi:hypothetical protein
MLYTEYNFSLPQGFIDAQGNIHDHGKIRCATGADEILVSKDERVRQDGSYHIFVMLSRLITNLGSLSQVSAQELENLWLRDFYYLQNLCLKINSYPQGLMTLGE